MSARNIEAVLVVGHGSRREEANQDVRQAAQQIRAHGRFPLVVAAFLEIAQPTIAEGFAQLVERGAKHIVVHPYFLSPGRHTRGDIPVEVRAAPGRPVVRAVRPGAAPRRLRVAPRGQQGADARLYERRNRSHLHDVDGQARAAQRVAGGDVPVELDTGVIERLQRSVDDHIP